MSDNKGTKDAIKMTPVKPVYNPSEQYTWDPDARFELTGQEFGLYLNTIRGIISSPESIKLARAMEANNVIENLMKKGVENGTVRLMPKGIPSERE